MKRRSIHPLLPAVSRKSSSWDKISWKESVASCLLHSFWRSMGKKVTVLINPEQILTFFGIVYIAGTPSTSTYVTFSENINEVRQR